MSKKKQYLLLAVSILVTLVVEVLTIPLVTEQFELSKAPEHWNLSDIVEYLETDFPNEASNVNYEVGPNHHFFIELRFDAPPSTAMAFAEAFCDGILHSNYDPFHAIDSLDAVSNAYLIRVWPWYYSYSLNVANMAGNRCLARRGYDQQVVVNKSRPDLYTVQYELSVGCGYKERRIPCYSPYAGTNRARVVGFPYDITGFTSSDIEKPTYTLVAQELCFLKSMFFDQQDGHAFIGATVEISVDNIEMPDGYVNGNGALLMANTDEQGFTSDSTYCLPNEWGSGTHTLTIDVSTSEASQRHFDWNFNVE